MDITFLTPHLLDGVELLRHRREPHSRVDSHTGGVDLHSDYRRGDAVSSWLRDANVSRARRLGRLTWAVLAAQSCVPSVEAIEDARRDLIVQRASEEAQSASLV